MYSYYGYCQTQLDCLILFEAARQGLISKRKERLSVTERESIASGAIFIWDEQETGIRRWTDGKFWSTSRVLSHFLVYRELDNIKKSVASSGCRIKPYGLCKQATNIINDNSSKMHLIGYYSKRDVRMGRLLQPSMDPKFRDIIASVKLQMLKKEFKGRQDLEFDYASAQAQQGTFNKYGTSSMVGPLSPPEEWALQPSQKQLENMSVGKYAMQAISQPTNNKMQAPCQQIQTLNDTFLRLTPPLQGTEGTHITQEQAQALIISPAATMPKSEQPENDSGRRLILPQPKSDNGRGTLAEDRRVLQLLDKRLAFMQA